MKIVEESVMKKKRWVKSSLLLLLISVLSLSYTAFISSSGDSDDWSCPSCPQQLSSLPHSAPSPAPSPTTVSHIAFAIGASAATWQRRSAYASLWWDPRSMRGHVWLDRPLPTSSSPSSSCPPVRQSDPSFNYSRFGDRAAPSRMARIVKESYDLFLEEGKEEEEEVRWVVMGDDDTVFVAENLVGLLAGYDHEEMWYLGMNSESVEQDVMHSYGMAFGGGGFAVSAAAAREVARVMDGCLERYRWFWGSDERVHACLTEIGVPLTRHPGFHQVDLRGDMYGLLAAHPLAPLISLHHLDDVNPIFPKSPNQLEAVRSLIRASKYDPPRILQQAFCYVLGPAFNWSISVSWGYSVQIYPWILSPNGLEIPLRTFQTWRSFKDGPFVFNTRPLRLDQECERPVIYFLDRVQEGRLNWTVSEYVKYDDGKSRKSCDQPSFVAASRVGLVRVIARRMDPNVWQKAPRRQCCETRRVNRGKTMEVKIRDCYPGEVTSPP